MKASFAKGLAGRPPRDAQVFLARQRAVLAARWVRSCRRALAYLNDPNTKIDRTWIAVFNSVGDRIGAPRKTEQTATATLASVHANVDLNTVAGGLQERVRAVESHFQKPILQLLAEGTPDDE